MIFFLLFQLFSSILTYKKKITPWHNHVFLGLTLSNTYPNRWTLFHKFKQLTFSCTRISQHQHVDVTPPCQSIRKTFTGTTKQETCYGFLQFWNVDNSSCQYNFESLLKFAQYLSNVSLFLTCYIFSLHVCNLFIRPNQNFKTGSKDVVWTWP